MASRTINKHGMKMKGIKKAARETKWLQDGCYVQLSYDRATGLILTDWHCSIGSNTWTVYHDSNVITVACAYSPKTMQEIADVIFREVSQSSSF